MSSDLKVTNIKHESSSSNNLVLASDGNVSITNTLSSGTIGGSVQRASGYPFAQYEILEGYIGTSWTQMTLDDGSSGVKYEYGGVDLANSNNDITVPSTGMYEINYNYYMRDNSLSFWIYWKFLKHTANISTESTGTLIYFNGFNNPNYDTGTDNTHEALNGKFYYSLTANDHLSMWTQANVAIDQQENPGGVSDTVLKSYVSVRKIFDL